METANPVRAGSPPNAIHSRGRGRRCPSSPDCRELRWRVALTIYAGAVQWPARPEPQLRSTATARNSRIRDCTGGSQSFHELKSRSHPGDSLSTVSCYPCSSIRLPPTGIQQIGTDKSNGEFKCQQRIGHDPNANDDWIRATQSLTGYAVAPPPYSLTSFSNSRRPSMNSPTTRLARRSFSAIEPVGQAWSSIMQTLSRSPVPAV